MAYFCAQLLIVCIVNRKKPRKRNTWDHSFVLIQAKSYEEAFRRALEIGREQETTYLNQQGEKVRWAFVRVESIKRLSHSLDGQEAGSLLGAYASNKPLSLKKRFLPEKSEPLFH